MPLHYFCFIYYTFCSLRRRSFQALGFWGLVVLGSCFLMGLEFFGCVFVFGGFIVCLFVFENLADNSLFIQITLSAAHRCSGSLFIRDSAA